MSLAVRFRFDKESAEILKVKEKRPKFLNRPDLPTQPDGICEGGVYDNNFREVESIGDNISGISTMDAETVFHNEDNVANNVEKLRNSQNVEDITFSSRHVAKYVDKHQISDTMTRQLLKL